MGSMDMAYIVIYEKRTQGFSRLQPLIRSPNARLIKVRLRYSWGHGRGFCGYDFSPPSLSQIEAVNRPSTLLSCHHEELLQPPLLSAHRGSEASLLCEHLQSQSTRGAGMWQAGCLPQSSVLRQT